MDNVSDHPCTIVCSNSTEELAKILEKRVGERSDVVVPSALLKNFLLERIPHDNVRIRTLQEFLRIDQVLLALTCEAAWRKNPNRCKDPRFVSYLSPQDAVLFTQRVSSLSEELARTAILTKGILGEVRKGYLASFCLEPLDVRALNAAHSIHVFGFSYIPPFLLDLLVRKGATLYQWSPCMHFWEDVSEEGHPLLARWGRLSRMFLKALDGFPSISEEAYLFPEGTSALQRLQSEILHLAQYPKTPDASVQWISAPSLWEEIECVRTSLEEAFLKNPSLLPSDVLVVAPEISVYAPFIQMVFRTSNIPVRIEGMANERTFSLPNGEGEKTLLEWWNLVVQSTGVRNCEEERCLEKVKEWSEKFPEQRFPFSTMKRLIDAAFAEKTSSWTNSDKPSVCFASLSPGCAIPKELIWIMGVDDLHFPRKESIPAFFEGKREAVPTKADEDRALLLELHFAAKDRLILSYVKSENQGIAPDVFVMCKLLGLSETSYTRSFSLQAHESGPLVRDFFVSCTPPKKDCFSISAVKKSFSHPLAFYFQQVLGIYLEEEPEDPPWALSALERFKLRAKALRSPVDALIAEKRASAKWPPGLFGEAQERAILRDCKKQREHLSAWNMDEREIFSVVFSKECTRAERKETRDWVMPAIRKKGKTVVGTLEGCTASGLLVHAQKRSSSFLAQLPLFLAYCELEKEMPVKKQLLFLKDGKSMQMAYDSSLWDGVFAYIDICLHAPSFFLPELAPFLDNEEEYVQRWKRWETSQEFGYEDPYIRWMKKNGIERDVRDWLRMHAKETQLLLQPFLECGIF